MKRLISTLSLLAALIVIFAACNQSSAQPTTDKLSKHELLSLIATAKTPAEHLRLAQYYEGQAKFYLAQSTLHQEMAAAYKKNPPISAKYSTTSVNHCDFFSQSFKEDATKMQELADMHEQMAKDAGAKEKN